MRDDTGDRALHAIHQGDVAAVLGAPLPEKWTCGVCGRATTGVPAAFLKKEGRLVPLCFECLLEQGDGTDFEGAAGFPEAGSP